MDLKSFYREIILDHYKNPRNMRELEDATAEAKCKNPSCGDRVTLRFREKDGVIEDVAFIGNGCAISQASTSMMTMAVKGKSRVEAEAIMAEFRNMVLKGKDGADMELLGDLGTLEGISKLHARVKCAMCGWSALEGALEQKTGEIDMDKDDSLPDSSASGQTS